MSFTRLLLSLLCLFLGTVVQAAPPIRVLLDEIADSLTVTMTGAHRGYIDGVERFSTPYGLSWPLQVAGGYVYIEGKPVGNSFTLEPSDGALVSWAGQNYRGALRFVAEDRTLRIINVVDLETYLRGVVPAEMQASWNLEALKAQAVAARTYTLASLDPEANYDVCATILCQKYDGVTIEHPRSDQAIWETMGVVLTYGGDFAKTYYHADSGGVLASSSEVWGNASPYLIAQQDVDMASPHRGWERALDADFIAASLQGRGIGVGDVSSVRVVGYSDSGRVESLEVIGSAGSRLLSGPKLTKMLREWGLKSTRFRMAGALSVQGDGWGHGVGMSQYGARSLARSGYDYSQILGFYYPSTELQQLPYAQTP